jgi:hypothetical protein
VNNLCIFVFTQNENAKERRNNNFPIWTAAFCIGLRCFVGHIAKAMLPSRASPDTKILTPKT